MSRNALGADRAGCPTARARGEGEVLPPSLQLQLLILTQLLRDQCLVPGNPAGRRWWEVVAVLGDCGDPKFGLLPHLSEWSLRLQEPAMLHSLAVVPVLSLGTFQTSVWTSCSSFCYLFSSPVFLKRQECKINVAGGNNCKLVCSYLGMPSEYTGFGNSCRVGENHFKKYSNASSMSVWTCSIVTVKGILAIRKETLIWGKLQLQLLTPKHSHFFEGYNSKELEKNHRKIWVLGLFLYHIPTYVDEYSLKYCCQGNGNEKWTLGYILLDIFCYVCYLYCYTW